MLAITGASGALYATRTMAALLERGCHLELIVSDYGRRLLRDELGERAAVDKLARLSGVNLRRERARRDLHASQQQGSRRQGRQRQPELRGHGRRALLDEVAGGIAHGLSRNLVERAADVMLKERRTLIVVPRETPMSLPQLRNMVLCAEAGAMILPAMPAFYQMPKTLDDLADFMAGKILSALGFAHELYPAWQG